MKVEFLSYIHYTVPPENVKPLPYVIPTYCEYWARNQFHPITDDRASNANCRRQLEQWVKMSNEATVYSYYADETMKRFLYNPVSNVVVADLQYYKRIGVAGSFVLMMYPKVGGSTHHICTHTRKPRGIPKRKRIKSVMTTLIHFTARRPARCRLISKRRVPCST